MSQKKLHGHTPNRLADRRSFLTQTVFGAGAILLLNQTEISGGAEPKPEADSEKKESPEEEVAPAEDLMREHGVLNRILLIYDEAITRLERKSADLPPEVLVSSAAMIRSFIEDYHEKLEENYLFPRFRKAGKQVELVETLLAQHQAGRVLTDKIRKHATAAGIKDDSMRRQLVDTLRAFNRMYRPHEAREDTVLFPAFKTIVSPHEYASLGEDFEKKEHDLFGEDGFEKMVHEVEGLERKLGIYELSAFTPRS